MLLSFDYLIKKYNLNIKEVLHVGAHMGEEMQDYKNGGVEKVILVEAIENKAKYLKEIYKDNPNIKVICACVSDKEEEVTFNITNNGQSSSMLELGTHKQEHPDVYIVEYVKMKTQRLDKLITTMPNPYFLNMDIQGAELKALKGMGDLLNNCIAIYTEVNVKELYRGCALLPELEVWISEKGFKLFEKQVSGHGWGDALFLR